MQVCRAMVHGDARQGWTLHPECILERCVKLCSFPLFMLVLTLCLFSDPDVRTLCIHWESVLHHFVSFLSQYLLQIVTIVRDDQNGRQRCADREQNWRRSCPSNNSGPSWGYEVEGGDPDPGTTRIPVPDRPRRGQRSELASYHFLTRCNVSW